MRARALAPLAGIGLLANAAPILELRAGTKVGRAFGPNDSQAAVIRLRQGESADVAVLQQGIDVVVAVRSPDGTLVDEVDSPNARNGDEPVKIFARTAGPYRIDIRPFASNEPKARIEIRVDALRSATETARVRRQQEALRRAASDWLRQRDVALPAIERIASVPSLAAFDRLATDARVIGLGEATHGSREFGDLRLALVRRAVEHHGYRLVALEDSASRWRRLEPYVSGASATPASELEWGWIGRRSRRELLDWARSWNLQHPADRVRIVGVDPQDHRPEREALGSLLEQALGEAIKEPWSKAAAELAGAEEQAQVFGDSGIDATVRTFLQDLLARLETDGPLLAPRMGQANFQRMLDYAREMAAFADFSAGGGPLARSRDWYMALWTLRALAGAGTGAKAIYWAHNSHVSVGSRSWGPTGALLRNALGCGYRALATTFGQGSFLVQVSGDPTYRLATITVPAASDDSIEAALALVRPGAHVASWDCGADADRGPDWMKQVRPMRWVGGIYAPGSALSASYRPYAVTDAFDGIVYLPSVAAEADPGFRPTVAPRKR